MKSFAAVLLLLTACGYSEIEMRAERDRQDKLSTQLSFLEQQNQELQNRLYGLEIENAQLKEKANPPR